MMCFDFQNNKMLWILASDAEPALICVNVRRIARVPLEVFPRPGDGVSGLGEAGEDHVVVQLLPDRGGLGEARLAQGGEMEIERAVFVFAGAPERAPREMGVALRLQRGQPGDLRGALPQSSQLSAPLATDAWRTRSRCFRDNSASPGQRRS